MDDTEVTAREFYRLVDRVDEQNAKLAKVDALIVKVDLMTDSFKSLKNVGTGVIVSVLATAAAILLFGGPP